MLFKELEKRKVPCFLPENAEKWPEKRAEIVDMLQKYEYGYQPPKCEITVEDIKPDPKCYGSKCNRYDAVINCHLPQGDFRFPVIGIIPKREKPVPAIVFISFSDQIPYKNLPGEEVTDNGVAVFSFFYKDVCPDNKEAMQGELPKLLYGDNRKDTDAGAISLWAWAASRVLDWVLAFEEIRKDNVAVMGQSRLGKTALVAAALDERFAMAHSNESGCCGAAISRDKVGENFEFITRTFPYWFCPGFLKYAGKEHEFPFDQDQLIAAIAPRRAYVSSAWEDKWADPESEYLACWSAGRVWEILGMDGFIGPNRFPEPGEVFNLGNVGYHVRPGTHTMTRDDWHNILPFLLRKQ